MVPEIPFLAFFVSYALYRSLVKVNQFLLMKVIAGSFSLFIVIGVVINIRDDLLIVKLLHNEDTREMITNIYSHYYKEKNKERTLISDSEIDQIQIFRRTFMQDSEARDSWRSVIKLLRNFSSDF